MTITLEDIPGLDLPAQALWQVKVLVVDGHDEVLPALLRWKREHHEAFKAIVKVLKITAQQHRVHNEKHVRKSTNPAHGDVYEMRAHKKTARMMFFYAEDSDALIICTNPYEKGRGDQDAAFARCAEFKRLFESQT